MEWLPDHQRRRSRQNITAHSRSAASQRRETAIRHIVETWPTVSKLLSAGQLMQIKAKQRLSRSNAPEERFVSGDFMPMLLQSRTLTYRSALRWAVTVLALLFLFATAAISATRPTPGHSALTSAVAISAADCAASAPASCHGKCQSTPLGVAAKSHFAMAFSHVAGSRSWHYAADTGCPTPIRQRLLRPPRLPACLSE